MKLNDLTDSLEEIQTEHRDLLKIALGKKISKIDSVNKKPLASLQIAPPRKSQPSVNLEKSNLDYLKSKGYIDNSGKATEKYLDYIKNSTAPFNGNLTNREIYILKNINKYGKNWEQSIKDNGSIGFYKAAISLKKSGYFSDDGELTPSSNTIINRENLRYVSNKFTSQHIGIINIILVNNNKIDKNIYEKYNMKTTWEEQEKKIKWMIKNEILTTSLELTEVGKKLRLSRIKPINVNEINEKDLKILNWVKTGNENELGLINKRTALSRIYRFQSSGLIDNNFKLTDKLNKILDERKKEINSDNRIIWIKENRKPRYDDLELKHIDLVKTLALETPFISKIQIINHFKFDEKDFKNLESGILNKKKLIVDGKLIECYALHWDTREILKGAGIKKSLKGKFQKDSHAYHDLMVYESVQNAKQILAEGGDEIVEVIHERSQFQAKESANDNKGMCHADAVLKSKSGGETAVEFGKYSVKRMIHKIDGFSQNNVMVYSDNKGLLKSYESSYSELSSQKKIKQKNVKFIYFPSIQI